MKKCILLILFTLLIVGCNNNEQTEIIKQYKLIGDSLEKQIKINDAERKFLEQNTSKIITKENQENKENNSKNENVNYLEKFEEIKSAKYLGNSIFINENKFAILQKNEFNYCHFDNVIQYIITLPSNYFDTGEWKNNYNFSLFIRKNLKIKLSGNCILDIEKFKFAELRNWNKSTKKLNDLLVIKDKIKFISFIYYVNSLKINEGKNTELIANPLKNVALDENKNILFINEDLGKLY